jgi:hypothetical protein
MSTAARGCAPFLRYARWTITALVATVTLGAAPLPQARFPDADRLACRAAEYATGCFDVGHACAAGLAADAEAACVLAAKGGRCPTFTWEKCCVANCAVREPKRLEARTACIDRCASSPYRVMDPSRRR